MNYELDTCLDKKKTRLKPVNKKRCLFLRVKEKTELRNSYVRLQYVNYVCNNYKSNN